MGRVVWQDVELRGWENFARWMRPIRRCFEIFSFWNFSSLGRKFGILNEKIDWGKKYDYIWILSSLFTLKTIQVMEFFQSRCGWLGEKKRSLRILIISLIIGAFFFKIYFPMFPKKKIRFTFLCKNPLGFAKQTVFSLWMLKIVRCVFEQRNVYLKGRK